MKGLDLLLTIEETFHFLRIMVINSRFQLEMGLIRITDKAITKLRKLMR